MSDPHPEPITTTLLLPGLDGTGVLLREFAAALPVSLSPQIISYPPREPLGYAELQEFVERHLPGRGRFALIGESFSGPLALRLAARAPRGLAGVVLAASFVQNPVTWIPPRASLMVGSWLFRLPKPKWFLRRYLVGTDSPPELVAGVWSAIQQVSPRVMAARVREVMRVDVRHELRHCPVPILFLGATHDRIVKPRQVGDLRSVQPAIEIEMLDAPHLVLERCPQQAAQVVAGFLSRAGLR